MSAELTRYTTPIVMSGTLFFNASSDEEAAAFLASCDNEVGIALVTLKGTPCQVRGVKIYENCAIQDGGNCDG